MTGLLEKDLRLILSRKSALIMMVVIGIFFTCSFSSTFSGAYLTILGTMLALSTLSYDDSDNCMAFIFTLPCTRKQYVIEKYIFVYGFSLAAGLIALICIIGVNIAKGVPVTGNMIIEIFASELPIFAIAGGLMIPLQLKFGPEKSRLVFMSIIGAILVLGFMLGRIQGINKIMSEIEMILNGIAPLKLFAVLFVFIAVLSTVSVSIAIRIIEKKEL